MKNMPSITMESKLVRENSEILPWTLQNVFFNIILSRVYSSGFGNDIMTLDFFQIPFIVFINSISILHFYSYEPFPRIQLLLPWSCPSTSQVPSFPLLWLKPAVSSMTLTALTSPWTPVLVTGHPLDVSTCSLPTPSRQVLKYLSLHNSSWIFPFHHVCLSPWH